MMSDPKFGGVARFCKRSRAEVLFVYGALLESCAERSGDAYSFDADAMADLLAVETEAAQAIHDAMVEKGLLADGRIVSWGKRQFTSDDSTQRVREHRERTRAAADAKRNADETLHVTPVTPPETETEADTTTVAKAPVVAARRAAPKPKPSRRCPADWSPSEGDLAVAAGEGFSPGEIDRELAKIRDYQFRDGHTDWSAVFRGWIRRAAEHPSRKALSRHERPDQPSAKRLARDDNHARAFAGLEAAARMRTVG